MKHLILSMTCAVLFCACAGGKKEGNDIPDFENATALSADSIMVEQILNPMNIYKIGDNAVIISPKSEKVAWVYSLPSFSFKYNYGSVGEGPNDFYQYPNVITRIDDSPVFQVSNRGKLKKYTVEDTTMTTIPLDTVSKMKLTSSITGGVGAYYDSIFVSLGLEMNEKDELYGFLQTFNASAGKIVDSLDVYMFCSWKFTDKGSTGGVYNVPFVAGYDDKVAVVYSGVYRMEVYKVTPQGHLELQSATGDLATKEQIAAMPWDKPDTEINTMNSLPIATEKYIYSFPALMKNTKNERGGNDMKILKSYMSVYGWDGHLVKTFVFDKKMENMIVDEKNHRVYGYEVDVDFEKVYVYDFKI